MRLLVGSGRPIQIFTSIRTWLTKFSHMVRAGVHLSQGDGAIDMKVALKKRDWDDGQDSNIPRTLKDGKVPRPPNAFILYRQHHHPLIKQAQPELTNNQICEAFPFVSHQLMLIINEAIVLGKQWKEADDLTKQRFVNLALQLKQKHLAQHPEYSYQPRKSGDKKRRMTPKKASDLNATAASLVEPRSTTSDDRDYELANRTGATDGTINPAVPLPELPLDAFGCVGFVLGNPDITPETFEAMINANNDNIISNFGQPQSSQRGHPAITQAGPGDRNIAPIVQSEATQEVRDTKTFFEETFSWKQWAENLALNDDDFCDQWRDAYDPQDLITEDQRCEQYDAHQHDLMLAGLERQANLEA